MGAGSNVGEILAGRYRLLSLVGAGGMGQVYRATDEELGAVVALKVLRAELPRGDEALERFKREVLLARKVTHRNVARTYDIGEHQGLRFLTMEYVDGPSLASVIEARGGRPEPRAHAIARAILEGLAAAHEAGVIHRDLKPDNVLIDRGGRVVLTDFGIARSSEPSADATGSGLVGTPAYAAPEQIEGARDLDARADVYAFGEILYELLTGQRVWQGDSVMEVMTARLLRAPPDPRARAPVPDALAALVLRCLARRREDRFVDARATLHAWDSVVSTTRAAEPDPAALLATAAALPTPSAASMAPTETPASRNASGVAPNRDGALAPVSRAPTPAGVSVAVLPIRNLGGPEDAFLADGVTEDLIDALSMAADLRVRPRGVVARFAGRDVDPREAGRELDVAAVVEGSLRRTPSGMRLSARLLGVTDGFQLWAQRFERPIGELLVASDEAARAVAEALASRVLAPVRKAPTDGAAVELLLRARASLRRNWYGYSAEPIVLFREALEHAPNDPAILAGFAMLRSRYARAPADAVEARALVDRALAAGPHLVEPWIALATLHNHQGEIELQIGALAEALRRAPRQAEAHFQVGRLLREVGPLDQGLRQLQRAFDLDPSSDEVRAHLAIGEHIAGNVARACELLHRPTTGGTIDNLFAVIRSRFAIWNHDLASLASVGSDRGAIHREAARAVLRGEAIPEGTAAALATEIGNPRVVQEVLAELFAAAGDVDASLLQLAATVDGGSFNLIWMDGCPLFAALRAHASWDALHARMAARADEVRGAMRQARLPAG